jgi:hypothetical protein
MKLRSIFLLLSFLVACTNGSRKNLTNLYQGSGIEQYFLSDGPDWMQFSSQSQCFYKKRIQYLNYKNINSSYAMSYEQASQFQYMINKQMQDRPVIEFKEQEKIFYNTYEKIKGGTKAFLPPKYKRIHVIAIDDYVNGNRKVSDFKKLMSSREMDVGYPVLMSMCLSETEMEDFLRGNGLANRTLKLLPREMFSIYQSDFKKKPYFQLYLKKLFKKEQKIYFYSTNTNTSYVGKVDGVKKI